MAPSSGFKHIQSVITQIVEHIDTLDTQGHPMAVGLTTGFRSLDKQFLLGLRPGELTAVAGRFNMGKTSLLAHLAIHAGCVRHVPVVIFTVCSNAFMFTRKMLGNLSGVEISKLQSGNRSDEDWFAITEAIKEIERARIQLADPIPRESIEALYERLISLTLQEGRPGLIIVEDVDRLVTMWRDVSNPFLRHPYAQLKALAQEIKCPIVISCGVTRKVESRPNKRPALHDLDDHLVRHSDTILLMYRDELYNPGSPETGMVEISVVRNHDGPLGTIKLGFEPSLSYFSNLAS